MLKRGEVLISGDVVNAQQVANQIAFKEAINKYNIKRIFTFHRSVATAKSFTGKGSEGIHTQLTAFSTFHVNGTMSTAMREKIMNEFKDSDYSVISNARCLTEGVDLPAVDMVAFMSPKKARWILYRQLDGQCEKTLIILIRPLGIYLFRFIWK